MSLFFASKRSKPTITSSRQSPDDPHMGYQVRFSAVKHSVGLPAVMFQDYMPLNPGAIEYQGADDEGVNIHVYAMQDNRSLLVRVLEQGVERAMVVALNPEHALPVIASSDGRVLLEVLQIRDRALPP